MSYIRVLGGFGQYRDSVLLVEADVVLTAMAGNPHFPDPIPSLSEVESAYNEYLVNLARVNWTRGRVDRVLKRESKARLATLLGELAAHVNFVAKGKLSILYTSGFPVFTGRKKGTVPAAPTGGRLSDGRLLDEIRFDFNPLGRDLTYECKYAIWTSYDEVEPHSSQLQWEDSLFTTRSRNNVIKGVPFRSIVFINRCKNLLDLNELGL